MAKIKIIVVGRTKEGFLRKGEAFYLERLKRYITAEWVEVKPSKIRKGSRESDIMAEEGRAIEAGVTKRDHVIAMDPSGKMYDSPGLAERINKLLSSTDRLVFIIGGPLGLSQEAISSAHEVLSLSPLTFTHEMARLVLLEQLYRAFTIMRGEKYHK
jgi:23S rRNA (pseudouridine1915-N3)-methyltransferase